MTYNANICIELPVDVTVISYLSEVIYRTPLYFEVTVI